jgi:hypothetical protein
MEYLEQQIQILLHKAEQERMACKLAEEQLDKYARHICLANIKLSNLLSTVEKRHEELEFLNTLTQSIVHSSSSTALFEDVLPLIAKLVNATFAIVFPLSDNAIQRKAIEIWKHPGLPSKHSFDVETILEYLDSAPDYSKDICPEVFNSEAFNSAAFRSINEWKITSFRDKQSAVNVRFLNIQLKTRSTNEYAVYFKLSYESVSSQLLKVLDTAKDLLLYGLREREYALKLAKPNKRPSENIDNIQEL